MPWNRDGSRKEKGTFYMKYQGNSSAFPFKSSPKKKTPDFSDEKQKKLYAKSAEYREYLKNKGVTYDAETNKSTTRTSVVKGNS